METQNASMRWRLVVYAYKNPYPKASTPDEAIASIVDQGVVSISINRAKNNPEGMANITMVGPLPKAIFHGNWVIIRSRVGDFAPSVPKASGLVDAAKSAASSALSSLAGGGPGPDPTMTEGIPRFIGQIDSVETTYAAAGDSGLVTRVHNVRIREWSHVFRQQVKFDLFDLAQNIKPTAASALQAGISVLAAGGLPTPTKSLDTIAKAVVNPFQYATIALAMVAGINKNAASKAMASDPKLKSALDTAAFYSNIATRMPSLPKSMLIDMGLGPKADPSLPFAGEASLVLTLLGNQKPGIGAGGGGFLDVVQSVATDAVKSAVGAGSGPTPIVPTFKDAPSGTFNGVFQSEKEITNSFKVPTDRPVSYGSLADFSQEFDLWSLLQSRCDSDLNEMFTDIWYHKDPTNPSRVVGRPVLVIRDKPFLFDDTRKTMARLGRKWTSFDDLPKVFIPSGLITDVVTSSTFNGAPNYIRVNLKDALIKDDAPVIATAQVLGRSIDDAAQSRYGGIFFSVDTPYLAKEGSAPPNDSKFDVSWWSDVGQVVTAWFGSRYLLPSGQLRLKDNNIPIMVGCNIVFKMGEAQYVAHVEGVSFAHQVNGTRGDRTTTTTISFSYLATYENGKAFYMGPESVQDLYKKSKTRKTSFLGDLAALLGTTAALEAAEQGLETAQQAIAVSRKLEKLFQ